MRRHPLARCLLALVVAGGAALALTREAAAHSGHADADEPAKPPAFKLEKVSERVYCLYGKGGNVGFMVTDAGVVVVDDQYADVAPGILAQIKSVSDKSIRYLINTHYHADHTGGNPTFKPIAEIVAHESVRPRLLDFPRVVQATFPDKIHALEVELEGLKDPADRYRVALSHDVDLMHFFLDNVKDFDPATAAPPGLTFDSKVTLWLGDQPVEVFHLGPGHTDGDSVVWFRREKVLHTGDLLFNGMVPFIDAQGGGSAHGYLRSLDQLLAMMPPDTKVIPGHGPVTDIKGLQHARDFLKDLSVEVDKAVQKGLTRVEAARTVTLSTYPDVKESFRTVANAVLTLYDEDKGRR
jgi:glyoxylase-like metal-dependent hydrolase (beta-lactamase superfamily II)